MQCCGKHTCETVMQKTLQLHAHPSTRVLDARPRHVLLILHRMWHQA